MTKEKDKKAKASGAGVFMNPKTDFGFKKIFGNKQLLTVFLNTLEALPEKIFDITYLSGEQLGVIKENRKASYDLYAKTTSGKRYIVEMQVAGQDHFVERMLLYSSYSIIYQTPKGKVVGTNAQGEKVKRLSYDIAGVYVIAILDFVLFKEKAASDIVVEQVKLMRQEASIEFTDKVRFVTIELPKFRKTLDELVTMKDKMLFSLKHMDKLTERPAIMSEEIFKLLYEEATINKLTQADMETYNRSVLEYDDVRNAMDYARREGAVAGERRGKRRGRTEGIEIGEKRGFEMGEKRGFEMGEKRGFEMGIEQERIKNVKIYYDELHLSIRRIAQLTGFSEEQVYAILDS